MKGRSSLTSGLHLIRDCGSRYAAVDTALQANQRRKPDGICSTPMAQQGVPNECYGCGRGFRSHNRLQATWLSGNARIQSWTIISTMAVADARSPVWRLFFPEVVPLMSRLMTDPVRSEHTDKMCSIKPHYKNGFHICKVIIPIHLTLLASNVMSSVRTEHMFLLYHYQFGCNNPL